MLIHSTNQIERSQPGTTAKATPSQTEGPLDSSSKAAFLEPNSHRPTPLANGFSVKVQSTEHGQATVTVLTPGGNPAFSSTAEPHTVSVDPEGSLVFANKNQITRWDPETGEARTFDYKVDQYGRAQLKGLVGLAGGRTLAIGETSMFHSPQISIHRADGSIEANPFLGDSQQAVTLSAAFIDPDRKNLYLSGHRSPKDGTGEGHGVFRMNLDPGQGSIETLVFRKTGVVHDGRAVITDRGEIITSEGNALVRRAPNGATKASYSNFGALRRDLGAFTRSMPTIPLSPNVRSSNDLTAHFKDLQSGNWGSQGAPIADGTYRYSAHRLSLDPQKPLYQQAGLPTVPFNATRKTSLSGAAGLLGGAALGLLSSGNLVGAAVGGALGATAGGLGAYTYEKIQHGDLAAQRQMEVQEMVEARPQVAAQLRAQLGLGQAEAQENALATVYQSETAALLDFPESGMFVALADDTMTVYDPRGEKLSQSEQAAVVSPGKLVLGETEYNLNNGSITSGDWLEIERGLVKKASLPSADKWRGPGEKSLVSYQGNGRFTAPERTSKAIPLEPEILGYPLALAPVANSSGIAEESTRLFEATQAFEYVDRVDRYKYQEIDPFHWTEEAKRDLVGSEVSAKLSDGTIIEGDGRNLSIGGRKITGSVEADGNGLHLSRSLRGQVTTYQQKHGAMSALSGGKIFSTKTETKVDVVNRLVETIKPDGEIQVQRWALPQNIASPYADMVRADRHTITPDGKLISDKASGTALTSDGQITIDSIDHFSQRVQVPDEVKDIQLLVSPEAIGHRVEE